MFDLIIIGGGPAGITAGIYGARKKLNTLLLTKDFVGQVGKSFLIENYPGFKEIQGGELIKKFREHLQKFEIDPHHQKSGVGVDIKEGEEVMKIKKEKDLFTVKTTNGNEYSGKAVIMTSGRDPRPLKVSGEKEFMGKGISYCVTCDGPLFQGKEVIVIGGGNSGCEAALELTKYCPKVYIMELSPKLRADEITIEKVEKSEKIEVISSAILKEIKGKDFVESITYQDLKSKKIIELPVKGVFIEIGLIPASSFMKNLVEFNERSEIKTDLKTLATKTPGLFAAGDVTETKYKQIIIAAGEGAKAALFAYEYLEKQKPF